jgi:AcrR family transcriptional regulator
MDGFDPRADPRAEREQQRERVLNVAAELFAIRGFDDVTMTEIAEASGVSRATVFNYYGSKHALIEGITEKVLDVWRAMLDEALADEVTPTPGLVRDLCALMAAGIESQRKLHRSVFREIARIQLGVDASKLSSRANEDASVRLEALMQRGQDRGELTRDLPAATLASAFHSLTNGTITNWLYHDASGSLADRMQAAAAVFLSPVEKGEPSQLRARGAF